MAVQVRSPALMFKQGLHPPGCVPPVAAAKASEQKRLPQPVAVARLADEAFFRAGKALDAESAGARESDSRAVLSGVVRCRLVLRVGRRSPLLVTACPRTRGHQADNAARNDTGLLLS